ncbi:UNVERIFIED_CONTAM: putative low molecular weight protein-tyrosine-phosphatase [Sesamum radiatum]|uniref:Low molecular weight protein-tyrosine-phosphatase n=1 Tax=Sesamum radiatum TaxID=300843 RepID=A0AAW2W9S9_SESRA
MASTPSTASDDTTKPFSVLFVCLGNICRSPAAEGVFRHLVKQNNLDSKFYIDSAGTINYHERIYLGLLRGGGIGKLYLLMPLTRSVRLMCSYCKKHSETEVPDPYYGGQQGFEKVTNMDRSTRK